MNPIQKDKVAQLHMLRAIAAIGVVPTHARFERGLRLPYSLPGWLYCTALAGLYLGIYWLSKQSYTCLPSLLTVALAFLTLEFLLIRTIRVPQAVTWFSKVSYSVYLNHIWALLHGRCAGCHQFAARVLLRRKARAGLPEAHFCQQMGHAAAGRPGFG
ncbi:hypothetical protein [Hymenobacter antarcticus]|uniref:Acyltransferase family protein n=1 Tax=Hymenobacter antarcticus TaxID=486270 RepID=A0ABP7R0D1_9BACT